MRRFIALVICILILFTATSCTITFKRPVGEWICEDPKMTVVFPTSYADEEGYEYKCTILEDGEEHTFEAWGHYGGSSVIYFGEWEAPEVANPDYPDQKVLREQLGIEFELVGSTLYGYIRSGYSDEYNYGMTLKFKHTGEGNYYEE